MNMRECMQSTTSNDMRRVCPSLISLCSSLFLRLPPVDDCYEFCRQKPGISNLSSYQAFWGSGGWEPLPHPKRTLINMLLCTCRPRARSPPSTDASSCSRRTWSAQRRGSPPPPRSSQRPRTPQTSPNGKKLYRFTQPDIKYPEMSR